MPTAASASAARLRPAGVAVADGQSVCATRRGVPMPTPPRRTDADGASRATNRPFCTIPATIGAQHKLEPGEYCPGPRCAPDELEARACRGPRPPRKRRICRSTSTMGVASCRVLPSGSRHADREGSFALSAGCLLLQPVDPAQEGDGHGGQRDRGDDDDPEAGVFLAGKRWPRLTHAEQSAQGSDPGEHDGDPGQPLHDH